MWPWLFNRMLLCGSPNGLSYTTSFLYRFPKSSWLEHICSACKRPTSNTQQPLLHPQESYNQRLRYFTKVPAHHSVWGPQEPNLKKKVRPKKKNWSKLYMFGMYRPWVQKRKGKKGGPSERIHSEKFCQAAAYTKYYFWLSIQIYWLIH